MRQLTAIILSLLLLGACSTKDKALREQERALRQQEKVLQARVDSARAASAMQALEEQDFLVLVDRVSFNHGGTFNVQSNINYVYVRGTKGSVQIASPVASPGPNGVGGLTFTGGVRNFKLTKDKKGNATATYMVSGYGTTANITLKLRKGHTDAHLNVDASIGTMGMTVDGILTRYDPTLIVKGYPD